MPNSKNSGKCTKYDGMEIYGLRQNNTTYKGILLPYSPNVTEYRNRNNGMLQKDYQTDLVTYISKYFDTCCEFNI